MPFLLSKKVGSRTGRGYLKEGRGRGGLGIREPESTRGWGSPRVTCSGPGSGSRMLMMREFQSEHAGGVGRGRLLSGRNHPPPQRRVVRCHLTASRARASRPPSHPRLHPPASPGGDGTACAVTKSPARAGPALCSSRPGRGRAAAGDAAAGMQDEDAEDAEDAEVAPASLAPPSSAFPSSPASLSILLVPPARAPASGERLLCRRRPGCPAPPPPPPPGGSALAPRRAARAADVALGMAMVAADLPKLRALSCKTRSRGHRGAGPEALLAQLLEARPELAAAEGSSGEHHSLSFPGTRSFSWRVSVDFGKCFWPPSSRLGLYQSK
ncbi:uncharacterized protein ACOB8E_001952 isoform 2-T6 [Sarcophilus harrisii]